MIALSEVQASLSLFAESLTGEPVPFVAVEDKFDCWPWSNEHPAEPVVLPRELDSRPGYRTVLLQQLLRQTLPVATASPSVLDRLVDVVESHRVVSQIHRMFPGASADLELILSDARAGATDHSSGSESSDLASEMLLLLRSHMLGVVVVPTGSRDSQALELIDRVQVAEADGATSVVIARQLLSLLHADVDQWRTMGLQDTEDEPQADGVPSQATTGVSLESGTPSEIVDNDQIGGGQLSSDVSDAEYSSGDDDESERPASGLELPVLASRRSLGAMTRTYIYDEWDYHVEQHRRAWCRVIEERLVGDDHGFITDVRQRHSALRTHIRQRMQQLPSKHLVRVHRSLDGDELDIDAAIEAVVDRRSGAPVDDRLQIRRDRAARDVATVLLVDLSASTSSPAVPPEPQVLEDSGDPMDDPMSYGPLWDAPRKIEPVRRVIDVAKDAVALMADALHELGDQYAVYGFSGTGRENVEFKIGKDFGDGTSASSWSSIAAMRPLRYTRMGPAVRHAAAKLGGVAAQTKLLIVVSDGYPQDTDYGRDRNDRDYGMHDTARALSDATAAGIQTFCVTIDPAGHDYLRRMCPDGRYLVIDDVESLPEELAKLYLLTIGA